MFETGDGHNIGPVIGFNGHSSRLGTGHMERGGAELRGALDAGARHPLHLLRAVDTFLEGNTGQLYSKLLDFTKFV